MLLAVAFLVFFCLIVYSAEEIAAIFFGLGAVSLFILAALLIYLLPNSSLGWYVAGIGLVSALISDYSKDRISKNRHDGHD